MDCSSIKWQITALLFCSVILSSMVVVWLLFLLSIFLSKLGLHISCRSRQRCLNLIVACGGGERVDRLAIGWMDGGGEPKTYRPTTCVNRAIDYPAPGVKQTLDIRKLEKKKIIKLYRNSFFFYLSFFSKVKCQS